MYLDAIIQKDQGIIKIVERENGKRTFREYPIDFSFYFRDGIGQHESIFGDKLTKIAPTNHKEFIKLKSIHSHKKLFESEVNYVMRCLEQNYLNAPTPKPHVAFFDIESAFDKDLGYSSPEDALNPVTAISVYLQWLDQMVCLAVPPNTITWNEAQAIANEVGDSVILFKTEFEMIDAFLNIIDDVDILSSWNGEFYDIPYLVNRTNRILSKHDTRRFCLWDQLPKRRTIARGGGETQSYDLIGRIHLDYLQLYKKYNYEERQSYKLDTIAFTELNEKKVPYDGSLDQLYKRDFKKFLEYNIQDTKLIDKLDKKLQFIELANRIAHSNCVLLPTVMGTVLMVSQAITIEAHSRGMIVPDKSYELDFDDREYADDDDEELDKAAGGWVKCHKPGLHKWVGSMDINSLYPSVFRAFNMSPETLVGQIRTNQTEEALSSYVRSAKKHKFADWWNDRFNTLEMDNFLTNNNYNKIWLDFEDGESLEITGAELRKLIFNEKQNWCITANGTIFRLDKEGVIPSLFTRWYLDRQRSQAIKANFAGINTKEIEVPERLR
jgi:DNA polymerase elongation subunit (family B)